MNENWKRVRETFANQFAEFTELLIGFFFYGILGAILILGSIGIVYLFILFAGLMQL